MTDSIPLIEPQLGGNTARYLAECVETNFVSSVGPFVDRFEREFAAYVGSRFAVACASGTAAIHLAMRLLGIGPSDEVFVPTLTFIASANPIVYERARPVFVDVEAETWNLDGDLVAEELNRRARSGRALPKAVEVVHLLGHPANMTSLVEACDHHGVLLIEDASEALGARWTQGRFAGCHVGTVGKLGCFSFNGNKVITTGGGGMITTDDERLAKRAKHLTTQARLPGIEYHHDEIGYNYRLTNLAAAVGVAQLELLPSFLAAKANIAARYDASLPDGIGRPPRAPWAAPSMWLYTVLVEQDRFGMNSRDLLGRLQAEKIQCRPIWTPLHRMAPFAGAECIRGAVAEKIFRDALSLPCSVGLAAEAQERIIATFARLHQPQVRPGTSTSA